MSFFFSKNKPRPEQNKARTAPQKLSAATPAAKRNAPALHRAGCLACPLNKAPIVTPKMAPTLAKKTLIYFLAEAPGRDEDEHSHKPLTGPSGKLVRECIPDGGISNCSFDNSVNCRPPDNRTPIWQEIECCRPRRIKYIEEAKPLLIVGMGLVPLHALLGSTDMAGMRGRIFAVKIGNHSCWYMPTYHPSFILKVARDKQKPLNSMMGFCFRMDIQRAFTFAYTAKSPHIDSETEIRSNIWCFDGGAPDVGLDDLLWLLEKARKAPLKAIDLETKGLRPFAEGAAIMSAAVSFDDTHFSFAIDHPKTKWTPAQRKLILKAFEALLRDKNSTKVGHNIPFELEWLIWLFDKSIADHGSWECTQVQAHFLDERRGKQARGGEDDSHRATYQSLDFLCKQHFGIAYKSMFKLNKKDMSQSDLGETLIYNGADTKNTLRLFLHQEQLIIDQNLHDAYLDAVPRQVSVAVMQTLGIGVNQATVQEFKGKLGSEITKIESEIQALKVVQAFKAAHGEFNPMSGDQAIRLFKDYLHRPEVEIENTDYGKQSTRLSVDKGVLERIEHPLASLILQLRNQSKLKGTYVDVLEFGKGEQVYPDGKIHCNFNVTFTETGRTSSDLPNMQNYPSRSDSWVRKQVIAGKGQVLIAFDYGQLEACTAAMCSKDKVLVKALWEDYDIHLEWAHRLYKKYPLILGTSQSIDDPKTVKKLRSLVKNKLVFPAIFGAQDKSIAGYLNCPEDIITSLMKDFWNQFYGLAAWQNKLMKEYYNTGEVSSYVGRARRYPLTRNQAINHPVQCLAAEIVCNAMNRLSDHAIRTGEWHLHPRMNIHDDITLAVPDDDRIIEDSLNFVARMMLTPPYECVNVPLSVKASVGANWFEMSEVGQFWSNKL